MAKKSKKQLQDLAKRLLTDTNDAPTGTLEDAVSICEYVSRKYGIELTVTEGGLVREILDERHPLAVDDLSDRVKAKLVLYPMGPAPSGIEVPADPEDMNDERAKWAENALTLFANETGLLGPNDDDDVETVVKDFLSDLAHFCDRRNLDLPDLIERAAGDYNAETQDPKDDDVYGSQFEGLA